MAERHNLVLHASIPSIAKTTFLTGKKKEERLGRWLMGQDTCHHLTT